MLDVAPCCRSLQFLQLAPAEAHNPPLLQKPSGSVETGTQCAKATWLVHARGERREEWASWEGNNLITDIKR